MDSLPDEILLHISYNLSIIDIVHLSMVNSHYKILCLDDNIWKHLYQRDYKLNPTEDSTLTWKANCILRYQDDKLLDKLRRELSNNESTLKSYWRNCHRWDSASKSARYGTGLHWDRPKDNKPIIYDETGDIVLIPDKLFILFTKYKEEYTQICNLPLNDIKILPKLTVGKLKDLTQDQIIDGSVKLRYIDEGQDMYIVDYFIPTSFGTLVVVNYYDKPYSR